MGLLKKITILSFIAAAIAGTITKTVIMKKQGALPLRMNRWECNKRDMMRMFKKATKMWKKESPRGWKKLFQFA